MKKRIKMKMCNILAKVLGMRPTAHTSTNIWGKSLPEGGKVGFAWDQDNGFRWWADSPKGDQFVLAQRRRDGKSGPWTVNIWPK